MEEKEIKEKIIEDWEKEINDILGDRRLTNRKAIVNSIISFMKLILDQEKQKLIEEIERIETKKHWDIHLEFLYRHRKQAEIVKDLSYLLAMEKEIKNSENWYKNIFGEKELATFKKEKEIINK